MSNYRHPAKSDLDAGVSRSGTRDLGDSTKLSMPMRLHEPLQSAGDRCEPIVTPIVHSSTYTVTGMDHFRTALEEGSQLYIRFGSPTCDAAEAAINQLEGGAGSAVYGSGMAAISSAILAFVKSGDHIVSCYPLCGTAYEFILGLKHRFNIDVTWVGVSVDEYRNAIRPNTTVLYAETPCNPIASIIDLEEFGKLGSEGQGRWVTIVDSTFASPYLQKPIKYGVDVVVHSATKYLGGHMDISGGVATARTVEQWRKLTAIRYEFGCLLSPFDASLLLRGLKTLHIRIDRQSETAHLIAEFLESQTDVVDTVYYPGLKSNSGHAIAKRQMLKFGGVITFEIKGGMTAAKKFAESLSVFSIAYSMGGVSSLVQLPASMTHGPQTMTQAERQRGVIADGLIRLSVGIEDANDLMEDVKVALHKVKAFLTSINNEAIESNGDSTVQH